MIKEYQVTLICATGEYKPVSAIVKANTDDFAKMGKIVFTTMIKQKGITKICEKRYWTNSDLKKYHYTRVKIREYDKARIDAENKQRYEQIKEDNYNKGIWKRPKKEVKEEH